MIKKRNQPERAVAAPAAPRPAGPPAGAGVASLPEWRLQMAMLAVENIHESIYWLDIDGRILYVNPAAERELGYSAAELQQMRVSDIDPNVPPEK